MKRIAVTLSILAAFVLCCSLSHSCANTTTAPSGGPKDTIPPVLVSVSPEQNHTEFPVTNGKIQLLYDEYTIVKNPAEILVSPPVKKKPTTKVKNKYIVVTFNDTLQSDRTYTINFGNALADNNEGNPAPGFTYVFSTGTVIDSMYVTGKIIDSKTLKPVKGVLVSLFSDLSDSACFNVLPDAIARSDEWGFFVIRNIKPIEYQLVAYNDADNDYKYSPDNDNIAFLDDIFIPDRVVTDSTYELGSFLMKDTAKCEAREAMFTINLFKELQSIQYLQNSGRIEEKVGFLKFSAADAQIKKFEIVGVKDSSIITQFNETRDSMLFWINTPNRMEDSLLIRLTYMATDSLGNLVDSSTNLSLAIPDEVKQQMREKEKEKKDTTFNLTFNVTGETVDQDGATVALDYPALGIVKDSIKIKGKNPKGQDEFFEFTLSQDTSDIRKYTIHPVEKMKAGYEYEIIIAKGAFIDLRNLPNNEISAKYQIPKDENLSMLDIILSGVEKRYIIELLDEKMANLVRQYIVESDTTIVFPYIKAGKYTMRITEDANANGISDAGNFLQKRQPEKVLFYEVNPGQSVFEIPEKMEIEQEINLKRMFE